LSPAAIERARSESAARGLDFPLFVADMLDLTSIGEEEFDSVLCFGQCPPPPCGRGRASASSNTNSE
jgi:hypothetical protein